MNSQRRHQRIEFGNQRVNATLAIVKPNGTTGCIVYIQDLSKSGAGCYIKFKVDRDTLVRLTIEGMEEFPPIKGKVVWTVDASHDGRAPAGFPFRIGIDFAPADDADRENQLAVFRRFSERQNQLD
jgi:hypothetical protein